MDNIETTLSWMFSNAKCKCFFYSPFSLTFDHLLTIFWAMLAYPHET